MNLKNNKLNQNKKKPKLLIKMKKLNKNKNNHLVNKSQLKKQISQNKINMIYFLFLPFLRKWSLWDILMERFLYEI